MHVTISFLTLIHFSWFRNVVLTVTCVIDHFSVLYVKCNFKEQSCSSSLTLTNFILDISAKLWRCSSIYINSEPLGQKNDGFHHLTSQDCLFQSESFFGLNISTFYMFYPRDTEGMFNSAADEWGHSSAFTPVFLSFRSLFSFSTENVKRSTNKPSWLLVL